MKSILFTIALLLFLQIPALSQSKAVLKASQLQMAGKVAEAIEVLNKAIEADKNDLQAFNMRAGLRESTGDVSGAIADLSVAIQLQPNDGELYRHRAILRMFIRDHEGALKDYDAALSYGLRTEKVLSGRASIRLDMGDFDGAMEDYRNAAGMFPESPGPIAGIATILGKKGQRQEAISTLQNFLDTYEAIRDGKLPKSRSIETGNSSVVTRPGKEPDGSQLALGTVGSALVIKGGTRQEIEEQIARQERTVGVASNYHQLARLYRDQKELEKALINVNKSLAIYPAPYVLTLRGSIWLDKGEYKEAVKDLTNAFASNPMMTAGGLADRGIAYLFLGRDDDAQKDFDTYLQKFPNNKDKLETRIADAKAKRGR